jgi:hypothetical protein
MTNRFAKTVFIALTILSVASLAKDDSYYKAILKGSSGEIQPEQFRKLEESALKNYSQAETYQSLAKSFGDTTEKVWAVIYGEAYCNAAADSGSAREMGSLVFHWYEKSLSRHGTGLSIDLTENAQARPGQVPFESQFEQTFLFSAVPLASDVSPLSIRKLTDIRKNQVLLWQNKGMRATELVRRQQAILSAGHFDAYNYWLFQGANQDEFNTWIKQHSQQFQAWLDWLQGNKFQIQAPDLQRLYILSNAK